MYLEKEDVSEKNKTIAYFLCFFFGIYGLHRFYAGKWKSGLIFLLFGGSGFVLNVTRNIGGFLPNYLSIMAFLLVIVGVLYDLFAMYQEAFLDSKGKIIISGSRQDELVGRTFQEKELCKGYILVISLCFILYAVLYLVLMKI